eukprot:TRINITY_DN37566_c0_g1_i1.p1 TRINITY_DN37566_c0_g1~~TRINITY_DN37566_c0_g1_i1.p1  ORF type:complete len:248 (+),score=70.77 TRINITY_DN37566_c0_g1_i1:64-744(+)
MAAAVVGDSEFDVGNLLILNRVQPDGYTEEALKKSAQAEAQELVAKLFDLPTEINDDGVLASLPDPTYQLPREKPPPSDKAITKWEEFRREKGIKKRKKEGRVWDEEKQEHVATYGSKRRQLDRKMDWLREVPDNYTPKEDGGDAFLDDQIDRRERVKKQKSREVSNQRRNRDNSAIASLDAASSKLTTASMGKFDSNSVKVNIGKGKSKNAPKKSKVAMRNRKRK